MAKCAVCGSENKDLSYVLMIRRDGSEAQMCSGCAELIQALDSDNNRQTALSQLKKYNLEIGDYEIRRFLDGVIASCDDAESYEVYMEKSRERKKSKDRPKRDIHRMVRPAALVLLVSVALYGIMRAAMDFIDGEIAAGILGLVLTAVIDGSLLMILSAVMDALDDVRTMRKRVK